MTYIVSGGALNSTYSLTCSGLWTHDVANVSQPVIPDKWFQASLIFGGAYFAIILFRI